MEARLLSVSEAAQYLSIEQDTVYWMVALNKFPVVRLGKRGGRIRIPKDGLDEWIDKNKSGK